MIRGGKTVAVGGTLVLVGVVVFVATFISLARGGPGEAEFKVPGSFQAEVKEPGRYYVWDNRRTVFEGRTIHHKSGFPAGLEVVVRDSIGKQLEFVEDDSAGWSVGNHAKKSVGYVELQSAGQVEIEVVGSSDSERVVSFSPSTLRQAMGRTFVAVGVAVALGLSGLLVSFVGILIVLFGKRRTTSDAN